MVVYSVKFCWPQSVGLSLHLKCHWMMNVAVYVHTETLNSHISPTSFSLLVMS